MNRGGEPAKIALGLLKLTLPAEPSATTSAAVKAAGLPGEALTDTQIQRLADCMPHSSIPDAIATIVDSWHD